LTGSDRAELAKALERIKSGLIDPELAEWCVAYVDGAEATGSDVLELVSTPPFIGDRRVVVVRSAEALDGAEALVPYVESPAPFSALILIASNVDKRTKLYQAVSRYGTVVACEAPPAEELPAAVARMAREKGFELEPAALALLVERAGDDMNRVESELEKLALYAGGGGAVSLEVADLVVSRGMPTLGQYAVFDFVDAIASGDGALALKRLDELLRCGEPPLVVLAMIARQLRLLLGAIAWQGSPPSVLAREMGLRSEFPAKKALGQARRWSADRLLQALEACADADASLKRGADGRRALEALTVRLACTL